MKKAVSTIVFTIALLTQAFISGAQTKQEMRMVVAQMNKELIDLAIAGRYEAMAKYYDVNAISLPNYRVMEKGWSLILNNAQGRMKGGYKIIGGQKTTSDLILGLDMMVDIGAYSLTVTFPGLAEPKTDIGKYMNVWKKDKEGNWRIVAETWNADKSPNAPNPAKQGQPGVNAKMNPTPIPQGTDTEPKK